MEVSAKELLRMADEILMMFCRVGQVMEIRETESTKPSLDFLVRCGCLTRTPEGYRVNGVTP